MGKFTKAGGREMPELNTSSLPDMIFAILFFFMVTVSMRTETLMVRHTLPTASEVQKLERKSLVTYINIGIPLDPRLGTGTRMQLNDKLAEISDIQEYIAQERERLSEADRQFMTVSIKADENTKMKYISDVKQALRKAYALKSVIKHEKGKTYNF